MGSEKDKYCEIAVNCTNNTPLQNNIFKDVEEKK